MDIEQIKKFICWLDKVIVSANQDVIDNYHTSGRKYYEGYSDALLDVKAKVDYLSKEQLCCLK